MKSAIISLLLAGAALAVPIVNEQATYNVTEFEEMRDVAIARHEKLMKKRQALGMLNSLMGMGGKVAAPAGSAPVKQTIKTTSTVPGARRIKMRHGPYSVINMNKRGINGEHGALWNYPDTSVAKPCTECTIIAQQAGLEYPDGKNANIDTGMWLHHMVHFTIGPGRWDPTCINRPSLPHVDVGTSPGGGERYFSSGNERTFVQLDKLGGQAVNAGYHLKASDRYAFIVDLMNMNPTDKTVFMTMTYDIVDGPLPAGWRDVQCVWFDVNQCMTSEVSPLKQSGSFQIKSGSWTPNLDGEILGVGGHLHDGGVDLQVKDTSGVQCNSYAKYGETPEYVQPKMAMPGMAGHAEAGAADKHISSMHACYFDEIKNRKISKGQGSWHITAQYDYDKFPGMKEDGKQSSIMGIALMYVAVSPGGSSAPAKTGGAAKGSAPKGSAKGATKGAWLIDPYRK